MVCKAIFIVHVFYTIMLESLTQKKQCFMYVFDYDLFRMVIKNACHNLSSINPHYALLTVMAICRQYLHHNTIS